MPIAETPSVDLRVLLFAAVVTILTGVAFGIVPLFQHYRDRGREGLREGSRTGSGHRARLRGTLVVADITASVALLVMCGLLLRALWRTQAIGPGFTTERGLAVRTSLPMPRYESAAARTTFYTRVLSEIRALPGVSNAAYISFLPMSDMRGGMRTLAGRSADLLRPCWFSPRPLHLRDLRGFLRARRRDTAASALARLRTIRRWSVRNLGFPITI